MDPRELVRLVVVHGVAQSVTEPLTTLDGQIADRLTIPDGAIRDEHTILALDRATTPDGTRNTMPGTGDSLTRKSLDSPSNSQE